MRRSDRQFTSSVAARLAAFGILLLLPAAVAAQEMAESAGLPEPVELEPVTPWEVYTFLERHCAECHGGHLSKPKGKFGFVLDLRRLVSEGYVIPEAPDFSDLYTALVTDDPDLRMPPEDSEGPKPTTAEIGRIHQWIADGARIDPPPASADLVDTAESGFAEAADPPTKPSALRVMARIHPVVVHFPVALLICAGAAAFFARNRTRDHWLNGMVRGSLWIGAIGALLAAATGWLYAGFEGFAGDSVATHRWLGVATALVGVAALVACEFLSSVNAVRWTGGRRLQLLLLIIAAVLVAVTGHTGGVLTYGEGYFFGR